MVCFFEGIEGKGYQMRIIIPTVIFISFISMTGAFCDEDTRNPNFDLSAIEAFWPLVDTLKQGVEPTAHSVQPRHVGGRPRARSPPGPWRRRTLTFKKTVGREKLRLSR